MSVPEPLLPSLAHLRKDKHLGAFIRGFGPLRFRRKHSGKVFQSLAEAIIYQQISGKAADTILKNFRELYPGKKFPAPADVLNTPAPKLRSAGLSNQKAAYIQDLALKCTDGTIDPRQFSAMSDAEIIAHVTAVKGIGEWTAHMFMMFTLHRPDILPTGDLGIQKAFQKVFKLKKKPDATQMEKLAGCWSGHRTLACMYLWRMLDTK